MFSPAYTVYIYFPIQFYLSLLFVLAAIVVEYKIINKAYIKGKLSYRQSICLLLLIICSLVILLYTVLWRRSLDYYRYDLEINGFYKELFINHDYSNLNEIIVNIVIFIPIGMVGMLIYKRFKIVKSVTYGFMLSLLIEVSQFILKRGYFEIDDLIKNSLGTFFGCLIACIYLFYKSKKHRSYE